MDADIKRDRLEAELLKSMENDQPMRWGVDDCALWCADILKAALGYDAALSFRGRYDSSDGAQDVLGDGGLPRALRNAARQHGWRRVAPGNEGVGDIALMRAGGVISTVICRAPGWFVGRGESGWVAVPTRLVKPIWAVA